ncbi:hypothetical protein DQ04_03701030 [Trypanosoma grayi]|uniref:hypothetical protein n=1 Tax=Trypanosoma grayi TaxID=71804 RepID=UPI0004F40976|nr:hypothetical protein DQ04_03701030 [Trypanosoma grayi]KEG10447.1 hypothetical protein DQ04_03701030 [Trypanosoma grayi]
MAEGNLLERLDMFFGEGANTDAIGNFLWEEHDVMQKLDAANDTPEALELYSLFKRYATVVDTLLHTFTEREAKNGSAVSLEQLAAAVMREWQHPVDCCHYLCTAYVAGALNFDSFRQLVADVNAMTTYPVGDELSASEGDSETTTPEEDEV